MAGGDDWEQAASPPRTIRPPIQLERLLTRLDRRRGTPCSSAAGPESPTWENGPDRRSALCRGPTRRETLAMSYLVQGGNRPGSLPAGIRAVDGRLLPAHSGTCERVTVRHGHARGVGPEAALSPHHDEYARPRNPRPIGRSGSCLPRARDGVRPGRHRPTGRLRRRRRPGPPPTTVEPFEQSLELLVSAGRAERPRRSSLCKPVSRRRDARGARR